MAGWAGEAAGTGDAAGSRQRWVDERSGCTCASCGDSVLSRPEGWVINLQCSADDLGGGGWGAGAGGEAMEEGNGT